MACWRARGRTSWGSRRCATGARRSRTTWFGRDTPVSLRRMSSDVTTRPAGLTRQYAKLCELPDFSDQELVRWIADVLPEEQVTDKPRRKAWEFGMVASFLNDVGALDDSTTVLDVAAGTEPLLYWLTNHTGQVSAVDIYGSGHFAEMEAQ